MLSNSALFILISDGSLRDALSIFDKLILDYNKRLLSDRVYKKLW